jgi:hypothetical protein
VVDGQITKIASRNQDYEAFLTGRAPPSKPQWRLGAGQDVFNGPRAVPPEACLEHSRG